MKKLSDALSPMSWWILVAGFFPIYLIVFRPSLIEFLVFHLVEYLRFKLMRFDGKLFLRLFPTYAVFFPDIKEEKIGAFSLDQKVALYKDLLNFPRNRAIFCVIVGYFKLSLSALVVVFYWQHEVSNFVQFLKFVAVESVLCMYYFGAVFIEAHESVSNTLADFHQKFDWSDVFQRLPLPDYRGEFQLQERLAIIGIWMFMMTTQWLVVTDGSTPSQLLMGLQVAFVAVCALMLVLRLWYLSRRYFYGGLYSIVRAFETFDPERFDRSLPLHSSYLLARFERTFNSLMSRLRSYERELSHWIFVRTEQSRYRALGELSGLIVHDLSGPLHVIHFCTQQLKENPDLITSSRYMNQLVLNGERSLELINSLRAYLKNPKQVEAKVNFHDVEGHIMRLLESQFLASDFHRVTFVVETEVYEPVLKITQADLIHIMLNLFANAVENLLSNRVESPVIQVNVVSSDENEVVFGIFDNGSGLSVERFEELTSFAYLPSQTSGREGLGLRLIRRLVERNGGTLNVVESDTAGTLFHLRLRKMQPQITGPKVKGVFHEVTEAPLDLRG